MPKSEPQAAIITFEKRAGESWDVVLVSGNTAVRRPLESFALTDEDALKRILDAMVAIARRDQGDQ